MKTDCVANHGIIDRFINRDVHACVTPWAEHLFDWEGEKFAMYDDFENLWVARCPACGAVGEAEEHECRYEVVEEDFNPLTYKVFDFLRNEDAGKLYASEEEAQEAADALNGEDWERTGHCLHVCPSCGHAQGEEFAQEENEIYEYWLVSDFLGKKLAAHGEPVLDCGYMGYVWGRTRTGQAIACDWVIERICEEMEILHGQKLAWA